MVKGIGFRWLLKTWFLPSNTVSLQILKRENYNGFKFYSFKRQKTFILKLQTTLQDTSHTKPNFSIQTSLLRSSFLVHKWSVHWPWRVYSQGPSLSEDQSKVTEQIIIALTLADSISWAWLTSFNLSWLSDYLFTQRGEVIVPVFTVDRFCCKL